MTLHINVPLHTRNRIAETGREQEPYMCLGVSGRGKLDEEDWLGARGEKEADSSQKEESNETEEIDNDNFSADADDAGNEESADLSEWEGKQLIATRCSNVGAVIDWLVVPFIVEDNVMSDSGSDSGSSDNEEEAEEL